MTAAGRRGRIAAAVLVLALAGTGGCASEPEADTGADATPVGSPLAGCAALQAPPARSGPSGATASTGPELPAVTLPCFTGDEPVALAGLAGPAVINLWASWCGPCREELPVLQRFADRAGGRVHVVGVVTQDTRARAAAFATDARVTFPALFDRDGQLLARVPAVGLPATLFVDREGQVRHLHNAQLDQATLERFAAEHLDLGTP